MLTVMCYNIRHGEGEDGVLDLERIAGVIRQSGADIIALQEVDRYWGPRSNYEDQPKKLAEMLEMHYIYGANLNDIPEPEHHEHRQYGIAILSKYPIDASNHYHLPLVGPKGEQRGLLETQIRVQDKRLRVYSTHLDLNLDNRRPQIAEVIEILSRSEEPIILMGDFNARPDNDEMQPLYERYQEAFAGEDGYSFSSTNPDRKIDYIFSSKSLKLLGKELIPTLASDHLPLVAQFE